MFTRAGHRLTLRSAPGFPQRENRQHAWHDGCVKVSMIHPTNKLQRSEFVHSLDLVWPTNQLRKARMDFWGAVAMVCVIGLLAKFAQSLLS